MARGKGAGAGWRWAKWGRGGMGTFVIVPTIKIKLIYV